MLLFLFVLFLFLFVPFLFLFVLFLFLFVLFLFPFVIFLFLFVPFLFLFVLILFLYVFSCSYSCFFCSYLYSSFSNLYLPVRLLSLMVLLLSLLLDIRYLPSGLFLTPSTWSWTWTEVPWPGWWGDRWAKHFASPKRTPVLKWPFPPPPVPGRLSPGHHRQSVPHGLHCLGALWGAVASPTPPSIASYIASAPIHSFSPGEASLPGQQFQPYILTQGVGQGRGEQYDVATHAVHSFALLYSYTEIYPPPHSYSCSPPRFWSR